MKTDLIEIVKQQQESTQRDIDQFKKKLAENYTFNFERGYSGSLYHAQLEHNILSNFLKFITEQPERTEEWLTHNIQEISRKILEGGFVGTSTSVYSNLAHTYKKEVDCKLLQMYKDWLKYITKPVRN